MRYWWGVRRQWRHDLDWRRKTLRRMTEDNHRPWGCCRPTTVLCHATTKESCEQIFRSHETWVVLISENMRHNLPNERNLSVRLWVSLSYVCFACLLLLGLTNILGGSCSMWFMPTVDHAIVAKLLHSMHFFLTFVISELQVGKCNMSFSWFLLYTRYQTNKLFTLLCHIVPTVL